MSDKTDSASVEGSGQGASSIDIETSNPQQSGETEVDGNREDISSEFAPTELIERPEVALEDVSGDIPTCTGRGKPPLLFVDIIPSDWQMRSLIHDLNS